MDRDVPSCEAGSGLLSPKLGTGREEGREHRKHIYDIYIVCVVCSDLFMKGPPQ